MDATQDTGAAATQSQACPDCGHRVPIYQGYEPWCEQCNWNVVPPQAPLRQGLLVRFYEALGRRSSQQLYQSALKAPLDKPQLTLSLLLTYSFSSMVHLLTLFWVALGLWLIIKNWPNLLALLGGVVCLGMAWLLRPRLGRPSGDLLPRDDYPTLYGLVDSIAAGLHTRAIDGISPTWHFAAGISQGGWPVRRVLHLGLPLFSILDPQQRVALLAHEMAHMASGDPGRHIFVRSALDTLAEWYRFLRMWSPQERRSVGLFGFLLGLVAWGLSLLPWLGVYVLAHLLYRDSQRAEYRADLLAARVSGAAAMISLFDPFLYIAGYEKAFKMFLWEPKTDFFAELPRQMSRVPLREVERQKRMDSLALARLDVTHPPSAYRIGNLRAHPAAAPSLVLTGAVSDRIDAELGPARQQMLEDAAFILRDNDPYARELLTGSSR